MPDSSPLSDAQLLKFSELALNPKLGEPFELPGKSFNLQFLTIEGEQELTAAITNLIQATNANNILEALKGAGKEIIRIGAIVLKDYDAECDEAWIKRTRGVTTSRLVDIVIAQVLLQDIVSLLGKALRIGALASAILDQTAEKPQPTQHEPS